MKEPFLSSFLEKIKLWYVLILNYFKFFLSSGDLAEETLLENASITTGVVKLHGSMDIILTPLFLESFQKWNILEYILNIYHMYNIPLFNIYWNINLIYSVYKCTLLKKKSRKIHEEWHFNSIGRMIFRQPDPFLKSYNITLYVM